MPSADSSLDRPSIGPISSSSSVAGTSSPVSTTEPSAKDSTRPLRSTPPSRERNVSATARRSRWSRISASRPSSDASNSTLPCTAGTIDGRSATRATATSSPVSAARRTAEAATVSAAATAQRITTYLDVALLQDVEQRDLDPLGQVGQLVDGDDPAVGSRDQAVVHGLGVAEDAAFRHLDRVDVTDQVADGHVGSRELLREP